MLHDEFHIHVYGQRDKSSPPQPLPTTYEASIQRLQKEIPEALIEYDGSIAWAGPNFQVVGILYDNGSFVQYVELRGRCSPEQLKRLLGVLSGSSEIDEFAVMTMPLGRWNNFQSFANSLSQTTE